LGDEQYQKLLKFLELNSKSDIFSFEAPSRRTNIKKKSILTIFFYCFQLITGDKNQRKTLHSFIKNYYKTFLSNTRIETADNKQFIEICHNRYNVKYIHSFIYKHKSYIFHHHKPKGFLKTRRIQTKP
jgi:hypothetical protein